MLKELMGMRGKGISGFEVCTLWHLCDNLVEEM